MGCCGCKEKEATDDQKQKICAMMAKELMHISVEPALLNADKIKIPMPEGFDSLLKANAELRKAAANAKQPFGEEQAKRYRKRIQEGGEAGAVPGSVLGMLDQAQLEEMSAWDEEWLAMQAEDVAAEDLWFAEIGGEGISTVFDNAVAAVEDPMSDAGKDVIAAKREVVSKVLRDHIDGTKVEGAVELCKGPSNLISDYLIIKTSGDIVPQLLTEIDQALVDHKGIKAWGVAKEQYNGMIDKIPAGAQLKPISVDIKRYICEQTVLRIGALMAEEEAKIRQSPERKAVNHANVFAKVFSGDMLTFKDYKQVCE